MVGGSIIQELELFDSCFWVYSRAIKLMGYLIEGCYPLTLSLSFEFNISCLLLITFYHLKT